METIIDPSQKKYRLRPILNERVWNWYKKHQSTYWVSEDIDYSKDLEAFIKLSKDQQFFILNTLAFFASSDLLVNEAIGKDQQEVTIVEYQIFDRFKAMIEDIHSTSYSDQIEALVQDEKEKEKLYESVKLNPTIKAKADWFKKWISNDSIVKRIIATAIMEGIFFSGSFCSIFYLRKCNIQMNGIIQANEYISRDEGIHCDKACDDYNTDIVHKLPDEYIINMIKEAVDIESKFVSYGLPVELIGMNSKMMTEYIKFVADVLCIKLINKKIYNVENPFPWMGLISMQTVTNFFEKKVTSYSKTSVVTNKENNKIKFTEDY